MLGQTQLAKRCRVIFTDAEQWGGDNEQGVPPIADAIGCFTAMVPPLHAWSILPFAAPRYLEFLANATGQEAPVLVPQAHDLLIEHPWRDDVSEFLWVVKWLFAASSNGIITTNDVLDSISHVKHGIDSASYDDPEGSMRLDISKPLADINCDIAHAVLARHDGNKSQAAKSLGISRTTLYSMLEQN